MSDAGGVAEEAERGGKLRDEARPGTSQRALHGVQRGDGPYLGTNAIFPYT